MKDSVTMVGTEMGTDTRVLKKTYIHVPPIRKLTWWEKVKLGLAGSVLSPSYWLLAHRYHVPGLRFRVECARLGLRLLCNRKAPIVDSTLSRCLFPASIPDHSYRQEARDLCGVVEPGPRRPDFHGQHGSGP